MTEYRHFRNREYDNVISLHEDEIGADITVVNYEEVQVVPLDAIVIRREELPETEGYDSDLAYVGGDMLAGDDGHRASALKHLAAAEHFREHPPVDEAQVQALASAVSAADAKFGMDSGPAEDYARELYSRGVRVEP